MFPRAFRNVAIITVFSAYATVGRYHSSTRKPCSFPFCCYHCLFSAQSTVSIKIVHCESHWALWCPLWYTLVVLNVLDVICPSHICTVLRSMPNAVSGPHVCSLLFVLGSCPRSRKSPLFSAAIKMLKNARCGGWLSFTKAV